MECGNGAKAIIRSYGGNCFSYVTKDGVEVMGVRKDAIDPRADTKPYAGGAPHCFPQFGPGVLMQHGFARGMKFVPGEQSSKDSMSFKLLPTEDTKKIWDHDFEYKMDVSLKADSLEWDLVVSNNGDKPFDITMGMHNYFDVSSLSNILISGPFANSKAVDKVSGSSSVADRCVSYSIVFAIEEVTISVN